MADENDKAARAGGPLGGEPAAGGEAYGSGGHGGKGEAEPSGGPTAPSDVPASNSVAPPVRTGMDDDVRATDEKARKAAGA